MSLLGKIFGSDESVKSTFGGIKELVDEAWFSGEERAAFDVKSQEFFLTYLETTQPQNLARRWLAFGIFFVWAVSVLTVVVGIVIDAQYVGLLANFVTIAVTPPFALVTGFYFWKHIQANKKDDK